MWEAMRFKYILLLIKQFQIGDINTISVDQCLKILINQQFKFWVVFFFLRHKILKLLYVNA